MMNTLKMNGAVSPMLNSGPDNFPMVSTSGIEALPKDWTRFDYAELELKYLALEVYNGEVRRHNSGIGHRDRSKRG